MVVYLSYCIVRRWNSQYLSFIQNQILPNAKTYIPKYTALTGSIIILFCVIQLIFPLRHHLYSSEVAWSEEGHRYSWRMMLRGKVEEILTPKQYRKFRVQPDMILFVAHHLRDKYKDEWQSDSVAVYPNFLVKLNGRKYQPYTDKKVDLAIEEWSWTKPWSWILPLDKDDFPKKYAPSFQQEIEEK